MLGQNQRAEVQFPHILELCFPSHNQVATQWHYLCWKYFVIKCPLKNVQNVNNGILLLYSNTLEEDVTEAAPSFIIPFEEQFIEEDDFDGDFELDLDFL